MLERTAEVIFCVVSIGSMHSHAHFLLRHFRGGFVICPAWRQHVTVEPAACRLTFDVASYMKTCHLAYPNFFPEVPFYPQASVTFEISPSQAQEHFHVPLTWSPFGYSTYRGS